jgi:hypothetical protein
MKDNKEQYYIHPRSDSPYGLIKDLFPKGIPVIYPYPIVAVQVPHRLRPILLWSVRADRLTRSQLSALAKVLREKHPEKDELEIAKEISTDGMGISHELVEAVDLPYNQKSLEEIEKSGLAIHIARSLSSYPPFVIKVPLSTASIFYGMITGHQNPSDLPKLPELYCWAEYLRCEVTKSSPQLGKFLLALDAKVQPPVEIGEFHKQIEVRIPGYTAYLLILLLQFIVRDRVIPDRDDEMREYISKFEGGVYQVCPAARYLVEMGWHPEFDYKAD